MKHIKTWMAWALLVAILLVGMLAGVNGVAMADYGTYGLGTYYTGGSIFDSYGGYGSYSTSYPAYTGGSIFGSYGGYGGYGSYDSYTPSYSTYTGGSIFGSYGGYGSYTPSYPSYTGGSIFDGSSSGYSTYTPKDSYSTYADSCFACHGRRVCAVCNGRRRYYVSGYAGSSGSYVTCSGCDGDGKCHYC